MKDPDVEAHLWKQRFSEFFEAVEQNGKEGKTNSELDDKFEEWYLEL